MKRMGSRNENSHSTVDMSLRIHLKSNPKERALGRYFPISSFSALPPHPENKATVPTVRFLAQIRGRRQREVRMPRNYQPAEGSWPFYLMRRQHRKTWDKMDCALLYPTHPSAFCVPVAWLIQQVHPQTPGRSQLEAETAQATSWERIPSAGL